MKKSIIFDLDNTLTRTQDIHAKAEAQALKDVFGISVEPDSISKEFAGVSTQRVFQILAERSSIAVIPDCIAEAISLKWDLMYQAVDIECMPWVPDLLFQCRKAGYAINIASASPKAWINHCIELAGIVEYFNPKLITSADECKNGKPAPDVFLLAADRIGTDPKNCWGIDDGIAGVNSSLAAGMKTIWYCGNENKAPSMVRVTDDMREVWKMFSE